MTAPHVLDVGMELAKMPMPTEAIHYMQRETIRACRDGFADMLVVARHCLTRRRAGRVRGRRGQVALSRMLEAAEQHAGSPAYAGALLLGVPESAQTL